jgi:transposase-like protein
MEKINDEKIININGLIDEDKCYQKVRELRWPKEVKCPWCDSSNIVKNGRDSKHSGCQHYHCNNCNKYFDDLTNTVFTGHHQPLSTWIVCLYFMGLNLSNNQIAKELDLCQSDTQYMTTKLREGIAIKKPEVKLEGEVEFDEVYIVAGHKGQPNEVEKKGEKQEEIGLEDQEAEAH